jgi:hypothetical protein
MSDQEVATLAIIRSEEHLKAIRNLLGWLVFFTAIGFVGALLAVIQAANDSGGSGF